MNKKAINFSAALLAALMLAGSCAPAGGDSSSAGGGSVVFADKEYLGDVTVGENTVKVYC